MIKKIMNKVKKAPTNGHITKGEVNKHAPILEVSNINKRFGNLVALKDINLVIKRGERIGLIGGNGAGKTTLSEIIVGLNTPDSGKIIYGYDFVSSPQERLGMQFQDSMYPSGLTVKDIVKFALELHNVKMSNDDIKDLLSQFHMEDFYTRRTRSLSGGQRQKLNILLSFLHKPEIVILDELSTGLDIETREEIIEFANKLIAERGTTLILISHHMEEVKALCDRIIFLSQGKLVEDTTIVEIEAKGSLSDYAKNIIKQEHVAIHQGIDQIIGNKKKNKGVNQ